jgi:hypothetical protein
MKKQTDTERKNVMVRELKRVNRAIELEKRTAKKRPIPWIMVDLDTGEISPPPDLLHVVK